MDQESNVYFIYIKHIQTIAVHFLIIHSEFASNKNIKLLHRLTYINEQHFMSLHLAFIFWQGVHLFYFKYTK